MADLASTCLSGKALRFYESLEQSVQEDWALLRQALLEEYSNPEGDFQNVHYTDRGYELESP